MGQLRDMAAQAAAEAKHEFFRLFDRAFPKRNQQLTLALPAREMKQ